MSATVGVAVELPSEIWHSIFAFSNSMSSKMDVLDRFGCHPPYQWSYIPPPDFHDKKIIWDCRSECADKDPRWLEFVWNNLPSGNVWFGDRVFILDECKRFHINGPIKMIADAFDTFDEKESKKSKIYHFEGDIWSQFEINLGLQFDGKNPFQSEQLALTEKQIPGFLSHYYQQKHRDFTLILSFHFDFRELSLSFDDIIRFENDKTGFFNSRQSHISFEICDNDDDECYVEIYLDPLLKKQDQDLKPIVADPIISTALNKLP